ncbi:MAG: hypothetical protein FJ137_00610 [Deltaproteobacteria bacterium]|nr:hypothetical protein [Deltaproteobacteria bacterium]
MAGASFGEPFALAQPRARHTATRLPDGRVLLAGGEDEDFLSTTAVELVSPSERRSVAGPPLVQDRYDHAAVALPDGSVVVAGGFSTTGGGHLASIERFDGAAWTVVGELDAARVGLSGFLLHDGRAVFFGGDNGTEIPRTAVAVGADDVVTVLPVDIGSDRRLFAAAQLSDGSILLGGGYAPPEVATVTRIDADGRSARAVRAIPGARRQAMAATLQDGASGPRAAVFGGLGLADVQVYDAGLDRWTSPGSLSASRASGEVVTLGCAVVVCGGLTGPGNALVATATCEGVANDGGGVVPMTAALPVATFSFSFTALDDRTALVAGGSGDDAPLGTAVVLTLAP